MLFVAQAVLRARHRDEQSSAAIKLSPTSDDQILPHEERHEHRASRQQLRRRHGMGSSVRMRRISPSLRTIRWSAGFVAAWRAALTISSINSSPRPGDRSSYYPARLPHLRSRRTEDDAVDHCGLSRCMSDVFSNSAETPASGFWRKSASRWSQL